MGEEFLENEIGVERVRRPIQRPGWTTCLKERILAVLVIPLAFCYYNYMKSMTDDSVVYLIIFVIGMIAYVEAMFWERKRTWESFVFLGLMIVCTISIDFTIGEVWDLDSKLLFLHLFTVYWILLRSGCLTEGKTSHMFMWDGLSAFTVVPFGNFPLIFRTVTSIFAGFKSKDKKKAWITFFSVAAGLILFFISMAFLKESDSNFAKMLSIFEIDVDFDFFFDANIVLFLATYSYGLIGGCFRKQDAIVERGNVINGLVNRLNKVPSAIWVVFISLFSVFYITYFVLQGSYMFDAFAMILPEKFTFSEYARKGFGEMCAVMVINFALLWLTLRTAEKKTGPVKVFGGILMGESLIFALIAFLKLFMYIQAYGFTPLRLQSTWLVVVLSFACICILISMYTGKKTARIWFVAGAVSLGALTLVNF